MYDSKGHLVEAINTSNRNAVTYQGMNNTLQFQTTSTLKSWGKYYFLLDSGIVKGTSYCGLKSEPIVDPTFWKIRIKGALPPKVSFTNSTVLPNSTIEELNWNVDKFVIVNCTLSTPDTGTERTSCDNTCIETGPADGSYTFRVHATDLDGLQTTKTHSWFVGNCSAEIDNGCRKQLMKICVSFEGNADPLSSSVEPPIQPPLVNLKANTGFSNEPVQLTISAHNLSGTLDDIIMYVNGIPTNTSFTKGTALNNNTLVLPSADFGEMNMTTTYQGEIMLTVHTIQHFALVNVSSISEFRIYIYPKVEEIDIHLRGCFSEEGTDTPVALLNSSVGFGNELLDSPNSTRLVIPKIILLRVPSWITPYGTSGGTERDYRIETNVLNGVLELNSRYEPFNVSVHVSIEPKGLPASEFSKSMEIYQPCIGGCDDFRFGAECNKECMCNINHTMTCGKFTGTCFCAQTWTGKSCNEFVCPCVYNHTSVCDVASKKCSCKGGWTGSDCATDIDECKDSSVCDKFPDTACQNKNWGYDCLCLIGYKLVNDTCAKINITKTSGHSALNVTTAVKEVQVKLHFGLHVPDTDNLMVEVTYERYKKESTVMLSKYYETKLGSSFIMVHVHNVSLGSLFIDHTVEIADNVTALQDLAVSLSSTTTEMHQFVFENKTTYVKEVYVIKNNIYVPVKTACSFYICDCEERQNKPYCRPTKEDSKDYTEVIVSSLATVIPAKIILIAICIYRRKRRKDRKKADSKKEEDNFEMGKRLSNMEDMDSNTCDCFTTCDND